MDMKLLMTNRYLTHSKREFSLFYFKKNSQTNELTVTVKSMNKISFA